MAKYTPEPWKADAYYIVANFPKGRPGGEVFFTTRYSAASGVPRDAEIDIANAARIVACVNYCQGMSIEELEAGRG